MKWIKVEDRLPLATKTGDWDGKKSDQLWVVDEKGNYLVAHCYQGVIDGNEFCEWYNPDDYELPHKVVAWMPILEYPDNSSEFTGICFTKEEVMERFPGPWHPEGTYIYNLLGWLNEKALRHAEKANEYIIGKMADSSKVTTGL